MTRKRARLDSVAALLVGADEHPIRDIQLYHPAQLFWNLRGPLVVYINRSRRGVVVGNGPYYRSAKRVMMCTPARTPLPPRVLHSLYIVLLLHVNPAHYVVVDPDTGLSWFISELGPWYQTLIPYTHHVSLTITLEPKSIYEAWDRCFPLSSRTCNLVMCSFV